VPMADWAFKNGQKMAGASVDFDKIIHADQLGALWPSGHAPSGGGSPQEEIVLDAELKAYLDARFDAAHTDAVNLMHAPDSAHPSLQQTLDRLDAYYGDPAHQYSNAAISSRQAAQMSAQVSAAELAAALGSLVPAITTAVVTAVGSGVVDTDALAKQVVADIADLLKGASQ